jgi:transposase
MLCSWSESEIVSDDLWERIQPHLPSSQGKRGGRWRDHRQVIEAVAWRYRTGCPWRDLPAGFGPWQTVWKRLNRWSADGTWERLVQAVQATADAAGELDWVTSVDSTVVRAHQHAAGARSRVEPGPVEQTETAGGEIVAGAALTGG